MSLLPLCADSARHWHRHCLLVSLPRQRVRCSGTRGGTLLIRIPQMRARGLTQRKCSLRQRRPGGSEGAIGGDRFATAAPRGRPRKCSRKGTLGLGAGFPWLRGVLSGSSLRRSLAHPLQTPPCPTAALNLGRTGWASDPPFHYGVCCLLRRAAYPMIVGLGHLAEREGGKEREEGGRSLCMV